MYLNAVNAGIGKMIQKKNKIKFVFTLNTTGLQLLISLIEKMTKGIRMFIDFSMHARFSI